jgi:hypothetical protein
MEEYMSLIMNLQNIPRLETGKITGLHNYSEGYQYVLLCIFVASDNDVIVAERIGGPDSIDLSYLTVGQKITLENINNSVALFVPGGIIGNTIVPITDGYELLTDNPSNLKYVFSNVEGIANIGSESGLIGITRPESTFSATITVMKK